MMASASVRVEKLVAPNIVSIAKTFNHEGQLNMTPGGFVYLSVSSNFIRSLYPVLSQKLNSPLCLQTPGNRLGAHISVFYPKDLSNAQRALVLQHHGKQFEFVVKGLDKVVINHVRYGKVRRTIWYVLTIRSPSLVGFIKEVKPTDKRTKQLHISIARVRYIDGQCYGYRN